MLKTMSSRSSADDYVKLGWACIWTGDISGAENYMRKAAVDDGSWEAHFGLGTALHALKKTNDAQIEFQRALALSPGQPHCLGNIVACEVELGDLESAEKYARQATQFAPDDPVTWSNLGVVLDRQHRYDEAIEVFERSADAERKRGVPLSIFTNYCICLLRAGYTEQALCRLETGLRLLPSYGPHSHYALALLTCGRMTEGWAEFEFRWYGEPLSSARPNFTKPAWNGQELRGRTILLRAEQGFGDFFQFIRYIPHVKALGARVLLQTREETRKISRSIDVDYVLEAGKPYPPFDYYCNLLSLPKVFGTDIDTIPRKTPYLAVDPELATHWAARLSGEPAFKIGVAWAGSPTHVRDQYRSMRPAHFAEIAEIPSVRLFSLQKGPAEHDIASVIPSVTILGPELTDFSDTAAVISQLDLIICVDTSIAHLAGALGKPVWLLLPIPSDWRWLQGRDDSPWYPTMRLFRQKRQGDWADVMGRVRDALVVRMTNRDSETQLVTDEPRRDQAEDYRVGPPRFRWPTGNTSEVAETLHGIVQYAPGESSMSRSIAYYGEYLQAQVDLLARMVGPDDFVVESGAGVGMHALAIGKSIGPSGHMYLYENDSLNKHMLPQNLAANRINNYTVMRRALGKIVRSNVGGLKKPFDQGHSEIGEIETIDGLGLQRLNWIKGSDSADVIDLIDGSKETIWRLRPKIFVAVASESLLEESAVLLRTFSYRTWNVQTPLFRAGNFNRRDEDIFDGRGVISLLGIPEEIEVDLELEGCKEIL